MRGFFSALAFLTSIPIPEALKSRRENGMLPWFPAAGLLIGGLLSLLWWAASFVLPAAAAAVLLIAAWFLLTGAIHLDGLADCADAFYGRRDREKVHAILKDPRIGTMGGLAIGVDLLARFASLTSAPWAALLAGIPAAAVLSRAACLLAMRVLPYASGESRTLRAAPSVGPGLLAVPYGGGFLLAHLLEEDRGEHGRRAGRHHRDCRDRLPPHPLRGGTDRASAGRRILVHSR